MSEKLDLGKFIGCDNPDEVVAEPIHRRAAPAPAEPTASDTEAAFHSIAAMRCYAHEGHPLYRERDLNDLAALLARVRQEATKAETERCAKVLTDLGANHMIDAGVRTGFLDGAAAIRSKP